MAWTTADIPDLSGKVAVVTGGNGGLGLEVVRELVRKGAVVVIAARDAAKTAAARDAIATEIPARRWRRNPSTSRRSTRWWKPPPRSSRATSPSTSSSTTPG